MKMRISGRLYTALAKDQTSLCWIHTKANTFGQTMTVDSVVYIQCLVQYTAALKRALSSSAMKYHVTGSISCRNEDKQYEEEVH